jgi:endonuclease/exonuclease/phosphatase family metal-dependent hydrolase
MPMARTKTLICILLTTSLLAPVALSAEEAAGPTLRALTYNVWHGLRSGESNKRFPGEEEERKERRLALQVEEIKRLDPDVVFFQEVNFNQPLSRWYAERLGYDEIHKVTSCGLHLGGIYKIPKNVNEGIAILAKPELGLRRVGKKRLSGNAKCTATWGFQTKESRYALFGEVTVDGRKVLLTTTHLYSASFVIPTFEEDLDEMVEEGILEPGQRDEILAAREKKLARAKGEALGLLQEIEKRRARLGSDVPVILGGDFNAEPTAPGMVTIREAGFLEAGSGPNLLTWDPVKNEVNYGIGSKRTYPFPTFDIPEVEELQDHRHTTPRQIDHLFVSPDFKVISAEMVLHQEKGGMYLSDHFGILAALELR